MDRRGQNVAANHRAGQAALTGSGLDAAQGVAVQGQVYKGQETPQAPPFMQGHLIRLQIRVVDMRALHERLSDMRARATGVRAPEGEANTIDGVSNSMAGALEATIGQLEDLFSECFSILSDLEGFV
jgi:hypothetical protein